MESSSFLMLVDASDGETGAALPSSGITWDSWGCVAMAFPVPVSAILGQQARLIKKSSELE